MIEQKEIDDMLEKGLITKDRNGELQITEEGMKRGKELLENNVGARQYMKKVSKYFNENPPNKEGSTMQEVIDNMDFIDTTELNIYERFDVNKNDDLRNYQLFCKFVEANDKIDNETTFKLMKEAKYFEIPDNINLLLQNTSNEIRKVKMPHYFLFLDFGIVIYDKVFHSSLISDWIQINEKLKSNKLPEQIEVVSFYSSEEGVGWAKFDLLKPTKDKYIKKLQEYLFNFVDFVNNEDVKLMFRERTEKNEARRLRNGRIPIPSFSKIRVQGYLAKYLGELQSQEIKTRLSHRFWVRGHYRRFLDKKKYKKLYEEYKEGKLRDIEGKKYNLEEGFLRIWVLPHIRGEGMLIERRYKLK